MVFFRFTYCILLISLSIFNVQRAKAEDGYDLWLRYRLISDLNLRNQYLQSCQSLAFYGDSPTIEVARKELKRGLAGLLGKEPRLFTNLFESGTIVVAKGANLTRAGIPILESKLKNIGAEGFLIISRKIKGRNVTLITANQDIGLLYGVFHFLSLIQTQQGIQDLDVSNAPVIQKRVLNHWDNLDGSVERGYAGKSIWDWETLPEKIDSRYIDYARANASIGINGTVLNNVNASPLILSNEYLLKVKAIADAFRPYGIQVYLSAVFSAPIALGGLKTADPLSPEVKSWWQQKADHIYKLIPDFGGFCIKANSEGQPGPQDYGRSHADGANMLADVFAPHKGIVMWRAFVYNNHADEDRVKEAYKEFKPFNGKFKNNVLLQVKNGPIDFQPREPFSPLFGAMPATPLMLELQITQEYLGFSNYLVYLGPLYKECLDSDTYAKGKHSTVTKIIEGKLSHQTLTGMAGVANIGSSKNWTGHPFAQANWYTFGRLAWDSQASAKTIAEDWIKMTFTNDVSFVKPVSDLMMNSHGAAVNHMTPLGLTMLMDISHYRPAPWRRDKPMPVGTRQSFHHADSFGIGFDRTAKGSNAVGQYFQEVAQQFSDVKTCPEKYLLWFHHLSWTHQMQSGQTLWNELCKKYQLGASVVGQMQRTWRSMRGKIDEERFIKVSGLLSTQSEEAKIWKNSCLLYFQQFSKLPFPQEVDKPEKSLEYYKNMKMQ